MGMAPRGQADAEIFALAGKHPFRKRVLDMTGDVPVSHDRVCEKGSHDKMAHNFHEAASFVSMGTKREEPGDHLRVGRMGPS